MTPALWVTLAVAFMGCSGWFGHWLGNRRARVAQDHVERKDGRADWAQFAGEMHSALTAERTHALAQASRVDGLLVALDAKDAQRRAALDHIDVLEAHIWAGKEPPPPARPPGL